MDEIRKALVTHGRRRAAAKAKALEESATIRDLARKAVDAGVPKSEVAKLAQISRPALDTMLKG